jgi:adenylosuccinate synthase
MALHIIIGSQWGDEGKGRITDLLAEQVDIVARYSGGDNAGHTITIGADIFKLHLIPSGIIHPGVLCLLGNGVVINPRVLLAEMAGLRERGVDVSADRLKISRTAHLITPAHVALDAAAEKARGAAKIGTTLRGIGPAYTDKTARSGLRAHLLGHPAALAEAVHAHITEKNRVLTQLYGMEPLSADAVVADFLAWGAQLAPHLVDGSPLLHDALAAGRTILAEGAQGTQLDLDHGSYPFVTSSSPLAAGALLGLGLGPRTVERVIGVTKAFSSRVGSGPFVAELDGAAAQRLRGTGTNPWDEFGTTTGRPRRVGWLDLVIVRHAARLNTFSELVVTKLDILSGLEQIPVCTAYDCDGETLHHLPGDPETLARCRPIYDTLPGWQEDLTHITRWDDLPANARHYIEFISQQTGVPVNIVSVGPARAHTIFNN